MSYYLVRVAPEISLKSRPVEQRFCATLRANMNDAFNQAGAEVKITNSFSRFYVEVDSEYEYLFNKIFGISSYSKLDFTSTPDFKTLKETILRYKDALTGKSFAVRVKRAGIKEYTSLEAERELGSILRPYAAKVDLENPDVTIYVDVTDKKALFFLNRVECLGGLPLGVEGKSLSLISGGFDSSIASWKMYKRGVKLDFLFCNLAGSQYERDVSLITKELTSSWSYGYRANLYILNFQRIVQDIQEKVYNPYAQIILKRAFYRAGCKLADKLGLTSIVTGESIGQVSSQTLANLSVIDRASSKIVIRPLITDDKVDILKLSHKIGMYRFSEHVKEYCNITKKHPVTLSSLKKIEEEEKKLDPSLLDEAFINIKKIKLDSFNVEAALQDFYFTDSINNDDVVIDCRSSDQYKAWHYSDAIHIDFDELAKTYNSLDKDKRYIIYCNYGVKSVLIAEKMQEAGFIAHSFRDGVKGIKKFLELTT